MRPCRNGEAGGQVEKETKEAFRNGQRRQITRSGQLCAKAKLIRRRRESGGFVWP